jgi:Mg2+ and Co2+ transporter CorA
VIELHLNIVSFDMNRVMRVLAVVSVLGLIPAVIGGLFGMNLVDNPWPFTLPQVAFAVVFGMVLCLYFFFVKGWLR